MRALWLLVVLGACSSSSEPSAPPPPKAVADAGVPDDPVALGRALYTKKGCVSCHTLDGTPKIGASLGGLWGTTVLLTDGAPHTVDAAFIRGSLVTPAAYVQRGFPASMPSYEGQLKPAEMDAMVAFVQSLARKPAK